MVFMKFTTGKLIEVMKDYFGDDTKRINHALKVLGFARKIQKEEGGKKDLVEAAAVLHDIGIPEAERKYNSAAGNYQEIEGPPIARKMLLKVDVSEDDTNHICEIIANHHSDKGIDTVEFRVIWDSDWLVNIPDELDLNNKEKIEKLVNKVFKTRTGREIAKERFLK